MLTADSRRPPKLYRYSQQHWLERALTLGEFRLRPAAEEVKTNAARPEQILPFGRKTSSAANAFNYLTLSLTKVWDARLFDEFPVSDCCLIIHDTEIFGERIHRATTKMLPDWAGIDAAVSYSMPSPLGAAFSKPRHFSMQKEWLFAWRPMQAILSAHPVIIQIGSIESIAELRTKSA
jgi:hypothetical protein